MITIKRLSILLIIFLQVAVSAEILTFEENETLYIIDLIKSGEHRKYLDQIEVEGCYLEGDTLHIGEERAGYGFSIGSLIVGLNDERLSDYEISGQFLIPSCDDIGFYIYIHRDLLGRQEAYSRCVIEIELHEEIVMYDMYDDRTQKEYWEELSEGEPEVSPDIWYDFEIVVKGSYVALYINDVLSVFSDELSSKKGGFQISVSNFKEPDFSVSFKGLKLEIGEFY